MYLPKSSRGGEWNLKGDYSSEKTSEFILRSVLCRSLSIRRVIREISEILILIKGDLGARVIYLKFERVGFWWGFWLVFHKPDAKESCCDFLIPKILIIRINPESGGR